MSELRIWHLMVAVVAAALLFAVDRYDVPCTPLAPLIATSYLCGILGYYGARWRGRRGRTGLIVGLLLGPLGVIWAFSNPIPERFLEKKHHGSP